MADGIQPVANLMKLAIKVTIAIIAIAVILRLTESPERKYMRCYNKTKSLEKCVPIYMEGVRE